MVSSEISGKRAVFMLQMSHLVDEWSMEEIQLKYASNFVKLSIQDRRSFPDLSNNLVSIYPGFRYIIQVRVTEFKKDPESDVSSPP